MLEKKRCDWVSDEPLYIAYHDHEWGRPEKNPQKLFEMLCLEGQQAGLSWWMVLQRRNHYRRSFSDFDPHVIASYDEKDLDRLLKDTGLIRHEGKLRSIVNNAQMYLKIEEKQSFSDYIWFFEEEESFREHIKKSGDIPSESPASIEMSRQLKKDGFSFVGSKTCYAFMQAVGMVNDHLPNCFLYEENK